ncbi:MAG: ABC transporter substrate-binding protein [Chloroflexota bacterium]
MTLQDRGQFSNQRSSRRVMRLSVALLLVGTVFLTARPLVSAHPSGSTLPVLHFAGGPQAPTDLVNASLVRLLPNGKVVPALATWTVNRNHLVYTFTMRRTARFSNGHAVTAQDAAFSLKRELSPSLGPDALSFLGLIRGAAAYNAGKTTTLSGVTVLNTRTLRITITKPVAYFLSAFAVATYVFDRTVVSGQPISDLAKFFQGGGLASETCTGNQGAGPFMFICRDRSSTPHSFYSGRVATFRLVPNPSYYGPKPHIRLEYRDYGKGNGFYTGYLAGKVDLIYGIPGPFIDTWKDKSREFREFPVGSVTYFTPSVHLAPFDNLHCRLAAAYAIDRETVINKVLGGRERPTYAVVPKGMLGYYSGKDNPHYNLSRARSELARCPGRTTPVDLTYLDLGAASRNAGEFIVRNLADAGFNIKLKPLSLDDWLKIVSKPLDQSKTQLTFTVWNQDYPDPQDFCTILLRSDQGYSVSGWHNSTYDRLVDQAEFVLNRKKRAALYIRAQHIALSQGVWISFSNRLGFALIKPYIHGMVGGVANSGLVPKDGDWANVSISPH